MLNIVLCDDNAQFLILLESFVRKECKNIIPQDKDFKIGPAFGNGEDVIEYIKNNHVDVLLLDIDMPNLNGFEVARILCKDYKDIKIVFMSAYDNFVYSAFEFYPFAYLRKSHISEELPKVLKRIVEKLHESERQLTLETSEGMKRVDVSSIAYVESKRNYYSVHLVHGKEYTCRGALSDFEKEVSEYDFFRIHSAYLVNLEHIERMLDKGYVLVKNASLPIAQRRMQEFKKEYMEYIRRHFGA